MRPPIMQKNCTKMLSIFQESDWFILNENGQRERPMTEDEVADVKKMLLEEKIKEVRGQISQADQETNSNQFDDQQINLAGNTAEDTFSENAQLDYDDIIVSQRPVELSGGFLPIEGPVQPISDQLAS